MRNSLMKDKLVKAGVVPEAVEPPKSAKNKTVPKVLATKPPTASKKAVPVPLPPTPSRYAKPKTKTRSQLALHLLIPKEPEPEVSHALPPSPIPETPIIVAPLIEPTPEPTPEPIPDLEPPKIQTLEVAPAAELEWLDKPFALSEQVHALVDQLRDARSKIVFALEQGMAREKAAQDELSRAQTKLDQVQFENEEQREYLRKVNRSISGCAVIAESTSALLPAHFATGHGKRQKHMEAVIMAVNGIRDETRMCRSKDVLLLFSEDPMTSLSAAELRERLPVAKQAHAKTAIPAMLAAMAKEGRIQRVSPGIYRALASKPTN